MAKTKELEKRSWGVKKAFWGAGERRRVFHVVEQVSTRVRTHQLWEGMPR